MFLFNLVLVIYMFCKWLLYWMLCFLWVSVFVWSIGRIFENNLIVVKVIVYYIIVWNFVFESLGKIRILYKDVDMDKECIIDN